METRESNTVWILATEGDYGAGEIVKGVFSTEALANAQLAKLDDYHAYVYEQDLDTYEAPEPAPPREPFIGPVTRFQALVRDTYEARFADTVNELAKRQYPLFEAMKKPGGTVEGLATFIPVHYRSPENP